MKEPKENWDIYKYNPLLTVIKQPWYLIKNPIKYVSLLFESIFSNSLISFLVSTDIKEKIRDHDKIHCHFGDQKFFIGYYCKKWLDKPLSVTIHAHELYRNNWKMFNNALNETDTIVTISDYNKKILIEKFEIQEKKIVVNKMFVDTDQFKPKNNIIVLIVASFHEKKGHESLFEAIKKAKTKNIELWVVGGTVENYAELDLQKLAKDLGIEEKVCFFGKQNNAALRALYNACDIFCLPSITIKNGEAEGIPVVLMEAMSYAKPVISTKHVGIPELVDKELVDEKNIPALTKAIDKLSKNKKLRNIQGINNRKIVKNKYSKKNIQRLVKLFLK